MHACMHASGFGDHPPRFGDGWIDHSVPIDADEEVQDVV
jgi:hypothetical protein